MQEKQVRLKRAIRKGITLRCEGRLDEALAHYEAIRDFFDESEPEYLRHFYCGLGRLYRFLGRNQEAIDQYTLATNLPVMSDRERFDEMAAYCNIAYAYIDLNRPDEAHAFLDHAESYFREKKDDAHLGEVLETRACVYLSQGDSDKAIKAAQESYDLLKHYFDTPALERARETLRTAMSRVKTCH